VFVEGLFAVSAMGSFASKRRPSLKQIWNTVKKEDELRIVKNWDDVRLAAETIATSFAGTVDAAPEGAMDWVLGPKYRAEGDGNFFGCLSEPASSKRIEALRYMGMFVALNAFLGNGLVCILSNTEGNIIGTMMLEDRRRQDNGIKSVLRLLRIAFALGRPPWEKENQDKDLWARFQAIFRAIDPNHGVAVPEPHVYVAMLGTHPRHQGQGVASRLLEACSSISEACNVPCYLEASGSKNQAVYGSKGFRTVFVFHTIPVPHRHDLVPYSHGGGLAGMLCPVPEKV